MATDVPPRTGSMRRDEIVSAATRLFARHGFHAVGMRAIADAVGIRGSSLYHHFPSKVDLLYAIARNVARDFVQERLPALAPEDGPAIPRLEWIVREHIAYFWEHRTEEAVGLRELRELERARYDEIQAFRVAYQRALAELIAAGVRSGELRVAEPKLAALALLAMLNGVNDWFDPAGELTIEQVADHYATLAVEGLLGARRRA